MRLSSIARARFEKGKAVSVGPCAAVRRRAQCRHPVQMLDLQGERRSGRPSSAARLILPNRQTASTVRSWRKSRWRMDHRK